MQETSQTEHRDPSIAELVHEIAGLASTIIRGEIALARLEFREALSRSAAAFAIFLVAAFMVMAGIVFLLMGIMFLLTPFVGQGWAAIIVTVLLFAGAALLARKAQELVSAKPVAVPALPTTTAEPQAAPPATTNEGDAS